MDEFFLFFNLNEFWEKVDITRRLEAIGRCKMRGSSIQIEYVLAVKNPCLDYYPDLFCNDEVEVLSISMEWEFSGEKSSILKSERYRLGVLITPKFGQW